MSNSLAGSCAEPRANHALSDVLLIVLPGVIWGASFLFIMQGLRAVGPHGVAFTRIATGFAVLVLFPASRRSVAREAWLRIAVLSAVWLAIPLTLFPFAEQRVSSALAGMLNGAMPLFAAGVAAIIARRVPSRGIAAGLAVGLLGVLLIALPNVGAGKSSTAGVVLVLVAIMFYGVAINIARPLQMQYGALPVLTRALGLAALVTAPLGIPEVVAGTWSLVPLLSLLALGALGTGAAYVLAAAGAGRLGATRASASIFITAPVAMLLGAVFLHERVSPISILGAAVCIGGAVMIKRAEERPATAIPGRS
ncbi:MAG: DMT family transporter [Gemmatimonadota bacterium]